MFDNLVKWAVYDHPEWALLWVAGPRSEEENDSSFESADPVELFCGNKDTTSLR